MSANMQTTIKALKQYASDFNVPIIVDETKQVLQNLLASCAPKSVLEIGTAIGYSGLVILSETEAHLTTIEKDAVRHAYAAKAFADAKVSHRVTQVLADAEAFLVVCNKQYDFIFLDGPKGQYAKYIPHLERCLNVGGTLIADNVLFKGKVQQEPVQHKHRTIVLSLRAFIAHYTAEKRYQTKLLTNGDGILIAKKVK